MAPPELLDTRSPQPSRSRIAWTLQRAPWARHRQVGLAARQVWDALCVLETTLRRPLPDDRLQDDAVRQRHTELHTVWARHGACLAEQLTSPDLAVVKRAFVAPGSGSNATWQDRLAAAREILAPHIP